MIERRSGAGWPLFWGPRPCVLVAQRVGAQPLAPHVAHFTPPHHQGSCCILVINWLHSCQPWAPGERTLFSLRPHLRRHFRRQNALRTPHSHYRPTQRLPFRGIPTITPGSRTHVG